MAPVPSPMCIGMSVDAGTGTGSRKTACDCCFCTLSVLPACSLIPLILLHLHQNLHGSNQATEENDGWRPKNGSAEPWRLGSRRIDACRPSSGSGAILQTIDWTVEAQSRSSSSNLCWGLSPSGDTKAGFILTTYLEDKQHCLVQVQSHLFQRRCDPLINADVILFPGRPQALAAFAPALEAS